MYRWKFLLVVISLVSFAQSLRATPYASGVSVNAGTVTFVLNEAADNVTVNFDGGASSQDLGALAAGAHTFNLGAATTFEIVVRKDSPPGYTQGVLNQISSDSNVLNRFTNQRGVAVNKNPSSPAFGRIYVSVSAAGTSGGRAVSEGIYVLNADQSEVAALGTNALTGGLNFATGGTESPHRITLGPDDNLYIGDWSDASGTLYVTDRNVANGMNVLGGPVGGPFPVTTARIHGSISAAWVEGSLANGDLTVYVIDEDLQTDRTAGGGAGTGTERNSIWRWDIGAGPLPHETAPVKFASGPLIATDSQLADLTRGPDGKWYVSQRRAEPANSTGVFVRSADGATTLWSSLTATCQLFPGATDRLGETAAVDVSPDGKWMATYRRDTNLINILPLIDGLPDMTNRMAIATLPALNFARDLGFDAAGNLYVVSSGQGLLRVLSPGGNTTATTRSDGTFNIVVLNLPRITVVASDGQGLEQGLDAVSFTFTRTGDTSGALTVDYALSGTAVNGTDYDTVPLAIEFPAGAAEVTLTITPIDDAVAEFAETVNLNLTSSTLYAVQNPSSASAVITDNEQPTLRLRSTAKTNIYEPLPADSVTVTVERLGETNAEIFSVELVHTGAATEFDDFTRTPPFFSMLPGVISQAVTYTTVNDALVEGDEPAIITLGGGSGEYLIDAQNTVTMVIRDDDLPPLPVLFAEDFNNAGASANWQERFGANNGIYDAEVRWAYDYGAAGIPMAPKTQDGTALGLFMTVNKTNPALSSAGINFYPIGQSFSGDYALRFDMYLSFGALTTTEHALVGINHSGDKVNRATQSTDANDTTAGGDGFWVGIVTDASNLRDYSAYIYPTPASLPTIVTNRSASTLTGLITRPPYSIAGSPGSSGTSRSWSEVELSQVNDVITLKVNNAVIWQYENTGGPNSGNIMIGSNDQFDSIGTNTQHFVIFDNLRVVNLSSDIEITSVQLRAIHEIRIEFTSPSGGASSDYVLEHRSSLGSGDWDIDLTAEINTLGGNQFEAITARVGDQHYYRIRKR